MTRDCQSITPARSRGILLAKISFVQSRSLRLKKLYDQETTISITNDEKISPKLPSFTICMWYKGHGPGGMWSKNTSFDTFMQKTKSAKDDVKRAHFTFGSPLERR